MTRLLCALGMPILSQLGQEQITRSKSALETLILTMRQHWKSEE